MLSRMQQNALIGFHAYTGNDYVSSFLRKTKKTWTTVAEDDELLQFFCNLGEDNLTENLHKEAEHFICRIYGSKIMTSVNYGQTYFGIG